MENGSNVGFDDHLSMIYFHTYIDCYTNQTHTDNNIQKSYISISLFSL